jgi:hypothetical protein
LCQSTTSRDRRKRAIIHASTSVGIDGGFCTRIKSGRGIFQRIRPNLNADRRPSTIANSAYSVIDGPARRRSRGSAIRCTVMRG